MGLFGAHPYNFDVRNVLHMVTKRTPGLGVLLGYTLRDNLQSIEIRIDAHPLLKEYPHRPRQPPCITSTPGFPVYKQKQ